MSEKNQDSPWLEACFFENQQNFPPEELFRYAGQHIAWSWDGSRIVASGANDEEVYRQLDALGIDRSRVVFDYVDPGEMSFLG